MLFEWQCITLFLCLQTWRTRKQVVQKECHAKTDINFNVTVIWHTSSHNTIHQRNIIYDEQWYKPDPLTFSSLLASGRSTRARYVYGNPEVSPRNEPRNQDHKKGTYPHRSVQHCLLNSPSLISSTNNQLIITTTMLLLLLLGKDSFPVAAATAWNSLLSTSRFQCHCLHSHTNLELLYLYFYVVSTDFTTFTYECTQTNMNMNMRWRAPYQEVDQRGHGQRLCKKIAKHVIWTERMLWIVVHGRSW